MSTEILTTDHIKIIKTKVAERKKRQTTTTIIASILTTLFLGSLVPFLHLLCFKSVARVFTGRISPTTRVKAA